MTELSLKTTDRRAVPDLSAAPSAPKEVGPAETFLAALRHGATVEEAERVGEMLLRFRDREEARVAEQAFNADFAKAMTVMPAIPKDTVAHRVSKEGRNAGTFHYSKLETILGKAQPVLGRHGLHLGFGVSTVEGNKIRVTAIVRHAGGYSIREAMESQIVSFGPANTALQNQEGTVTALKRTLSMSILGLAVGGDEEAAPYVGTPETINQDQIDEIEILLAQTGSDKAAFLKRGGYEDLSEITVADFPNAMGLLRQKLAKATGGQP